MKALFTIRCFLSSCQQPTILLNPDDQVVDVGAEAVFRVKVTGDGLQFQWQRECCDLCDGSNYRGTHTDTLHILRVEKSDEGHYKCIVTNDLGKVSSNEAFLSLSKLVLNVLYMNCMCAVRTISCQCIGDPCSFVYYYILCTIPTSFQGLCSVYGLQYKICANCILKIGI